MPFHLERIYSIVADSPGMPEFFVSYPLDKTTIYVYSLLFCQYTQDFCKGGTEVFQYTDAIRSAYSFRPRAVREDYLRLVEGREQDWKRDGSRACTKEQTFLIL